MIYWFKSYLPATEALFIAVQLMRGTHQLHTSYCNKNLVSAHIEDAVGRCIAGNFCGKYTLCFVLKSEVCEFNACGLLTQYSQGLRVQNFCGRKVS